MSELGTSRGELGKIVPPTHTWARKGSHDGLARAIRPAHTMFDGDTIFCMATGEHNLKDSEGFFSVPTAEAMNELGRAAADCMSRAIVRAVLDAHSMRKISAFRDLQSL